jgi:hypothetical protein
MFNYDGWNIWCEVVTIIHGKNLEFSMRLNWEFKIYKENKIDLYGGWMTNDILIMLVPKRPRDLFNNKGPFHAHKHQVGVRHLKEN